MNREPKKRGLVVVLKENENINQALRRLKKKVDECGIMEELRRREGYEKPTVLKKRAKSAAKARWQKKLRDQSLPKKLY
jgi:small subunit ribosomal protein S21